MATTDAKSKAHEKMGRPLRVSAFTGGAVVPAARFRVRQYIVPLAGLGVEIDEMWPGFTAYPPRQTVLRPAWLAGLLAQRAGQVARSWRGDVVLLQREMVSTLRTLEGLTRRPRILDVDDAIHLLRGGRAARRLAALADLVVVGNSWLAEVWRQWTDNVAILPTGVDTDRYTVEPLPERPVIGWIGTSGNLPYLEALAPAFGEIVRRFPETVIAVCCDRPPRFSGLPVRFVPWSEAAEAPFLASIGIGVMPLADGPWERGKCSFKMLQYMAAGRPCVVSPVGMNNDILAQGEIGRAAATSLEWREALSSLIGDPEAAARMGLAGRKAALEHYSVRVLAPRLGGLLRSLV
ncbi:MAG TPA: glycosyltransferase family 4 protein [Stellaceae bacterium]|jgi:glycosyltransferase involved in cell wall biosynthesis|nr:glycosyltransferase family 4 protein [Stellaceae bacterium]